MLRVVAKEQESHALQRRLDGAHLRQHVDAVAVFVHHLAQAADLALDAAEAALDLLLVLDVPGHAGTIPPRGTWYSRNVPPSPDDGTLRPDVGSLINYLDSM